ncbi:hypothetical protein BEH_14465 [Priestia filamentosa]|uniref:Uncharacterized protein n=1 Tax=Priestia filamentosa TaxID=1402861 RepID=A0A0H4KXY6_9BACI|nr:hypothetical protein BEH_14465 [Priestia filamentosa]OXS69813.1 hypothetical protein B1B01_12735 [Priestia filamentosa]
MKRTIFSLYSWRKEKYKKETVHLSPILVLIWEVEIFSSKEEVKEYVKPLINFLYYKKRSFITEASFLCVL